VSGDERFSMVQRVRFGDLDAMQHLNNVEFLRFFETARIDYVRTWMPDRRPTTHDGFGWIFAECHINYRTPAFLDEEIRTYVWAMELERSSLKLGFEMRAEGGGRLVAEGYGVLVGYDYGEQTSRAIPDDLRERIDIVPARA